MNRMTVARPVSVPAEGASLGLFTGNPAAITIEPANAGTGVRFAIGDAEPFAASIEHLDTRPVHPATAALGARHTAVAASDQSQPIYTVEHLLGALSGVGITDALVRIDAREAPYEVPIFDGSAKPFTEAIAVAGVTGLDTPLDYVVLPRPVEVTQGDAVVRCDPCFPEDAAFSYELEYDHPFLGSQSAEWQMGNVAGFAAAVAPARTFSLEEEAKLAQSAGLFAQFTPRDLLVIGAHGPIDNELRFGNEPAAHKLLDLVGDLALAAHELGGPIAMRVRAYKSGHALHHLAAQAIVRAVRGI
ncbi:MAG: UDP-3-O-acyl-N-acetylglucosamine deacetylase [Planctomycetota bacterium]